MGKKRKKKKRS